MYLSDRAANSTAFRVERLVFAGLLIAALVPTGCANPGQPKPPTLRLPEVVKHAAAERVGDKVLLTWTMPAKTTDGDYLHGAVNAVICLDIPAIKAGANTVLCKAVQRAKAAAGTSHTESLPAAVASGSDTLLTYRIELLNASNRSAGLSDPIFVAGGVAPMPTGELKLSSNREGIVVAWARRSDSAPMHLTRTRLQPPAATAPAKTQPLNFSGSKSEPAIVQLKAEGAAGLGTDPGGILDETVRDGGTYTYVAERVRAVVLAGHALELHSVASPPATFTYREIFPPRAPTGLVSAPGGGFGDAVSIDLSWDPNIEPGIFYNVYRSDAGGSSFVRLNAEPLTAAAYRDLKVEPGHSYLYRVTAVDQQHNESAPGDEIRETLRK